MITKADVLKAIDPCDPDNLHEFEPGVYTATFIPGYGPMDIEILRHTPGVTIVREPYEPEHLDLPNWTAVDFTIDLSTTD